VVPATAGAQGQFYGVTPQGALQERDYNRMRNGDVGLLRVQVRWNLVEPRRGERRWDGVDEIVGNAAARGVRSLVAVSNPPSWVRNPPTRKSDRQAFRGFMSAMARRYGHGGGYWQGPYRARHPGAKPRPVRAWQIFNEQNGIAHWGGRPNPRAYGRLVKLGARGVRSQNRRAEIVLGGMFATPSGRGAIISWRFLKRLYGVKGIRRFFDTVALHPYAPGLRGLRIQMQRIRKVMRRHNDRRKRIRVTEIGWGSKRDGNPLNKSPKGQARMLRKSFRLLTRHRNRRGGWNVGGVNWFSWQDGTSACPFCASSGLFTADRKAKRSWRAFKRIAG
jgi:hypothetical protein